MSLLEILSKNTHFYPDKVILEDGQNGEFTFSYIEEASARIYAYLSEIGIQTEDIVAIRMSRSANIYLVMLGVWKAGAAFTIIGQHSPQDYVSHVISDNEPKLVFDDNCFEQAMQCEAKNDFVKANPHDLACIVYSTGSSGVFKGAMHEYGIIDIIIEKLKTVNMLPLYLKDGDNEHPRDLMTYGFYSITAVNSLIWAVVLGNYHYVASFDEINDFSKQIDIINNKNINSICIAPSNHNKVKEANLPSLKKVSFSYDVTGDDLSDKFKYLNAYALTEAFGTIISCYVNKAKKIVPAGKPFSNTKIMICDESGNAVTNGEIGEICFVPEYFRGYKNRPELTSKVYYNGWFHTGDMGLIDEDGDIIILGRKIDMIKTKSGYIIPVYISDAAKKELPNITDCYVKLFGNSENYKICFYYCSDKEYVTDEIVDKIKEKIPDFMLPTHSVKMDNFEYFPSGKINRLSFIEPD